MSPEFRPEIGERHITPIEMAWYMLATVENNSFLELGITQKLETFLPKGPVFEGQFLLTPSKMRKAITMLDTALFVAALRETIAEFAYVTEKGEYKNSFKVENVTYGTFPIPAVEQQAGISDLTEQIVLCFVSSCIFSERVQTLDQIVDTLEEGQVFSVRKELLNALRGRGPSTDYYTSMAGLLAIHRRAIDKKATLSPAQVFELPLKALQIAGRTNNTCVIAKPAFEWLSAKWSFICEHQRFLLKNPAFYEKPINQVLNAGGNSWIDKIIQLLQAILPTMGFNNESQLSEILNEMRKAKR